MEREFLTTFKAVAARFKDEFVNLFGGGSAKLLLSDPENPNSTGIEIIARPPGKREQGLALLSGGERALTAAALIFSILKTRPTPFCVLDEVDAALDEANVGRFRDAIRTWARRRSSSSSRTTGAPSKLRIRSTASRWARTTRPPRCRSSWTAGNWSRRRRSRREQRRVAGGPGRPAPGGDAGAPTVSRRRPSRLVLYLLGLGTVTFWGASFPLTKAALDYTGPTAIAFLRWTMSAVAARQPGWPSRDAATPPPGCGQRAACCGPGGAPWPGSASRASPSSTSSKMSHCATRLPPMRASFPT